MTMPWVAATLAGWVASQRPLAVADGAAGAVGVVPGGCWLLHGSAAGGVGLAVTEAVALGSGAGVGLGDTPADGVGLGSGVAPGVGVAAVEGEGSAACSAPDAAAGTGVSLVRACTASRKLAPIASAQGIADAGAGVRMVDMIT
ncbi:MAG TPA: hypothetical protein VF163_17660, partial [Micromonosporaceae bacterium]